MAETENVAGPDEVAVMTKPCIVCDKTDTVVVPREGYIMWKRGAFVQDAFPQLDAGVREMLISGTHPKCWDEMFGGDEK